MDFEKVINAWRLAAKELNLQIQSPIILATDDNQKIRFELLIKDFGSKLGTIVLPIDQTAKCLTVEKQGFYCSAINFDSYKIYDRQYFIDTLNDWGYFGDTFKKPEWYTGKSWT